MRISSKRQIAIPKHVMTALNLQPGDEVDIRIEEGTACLVPITTIKAPRDQAWFWTKEWQDALSVRISLKNSLSVIASN